MSELHKTRAGLFFSPQVGRHLVTWHNRKALPWEEGRFRSSPALGRA
jgi:hypothetical protein